MLRGGKETSVELNAQNAQSFSTCVTYARHGCDISSGCQFRSLFRVWHPTSSVCSNVDAEIFNGSFLFLSHETDTSVIRICSIHSLNNSKEIHGERYRYCKQIKIILQNVPGSSLLFWMTIFFASRLKWSCKFRFWFFGSSKITISFQHFVNTLQLKV